MTASYIKQMPDGSFAYGWVVRKGRKDQLEQVGSAPSYEEAADARIAMITGMFSA